ncbi:type II toxin-antitoxin system RelE/ParE family toxin [Brevundimonas staleyi]|uniref:Type II toxin-antitoxin system RelE/ParE family toxin n=1 Tax=Brevundimonas staleyi TaxID=74326 RepID=A0ABW0FW18_9CAUL
MKVELSAEALTDIQGIADFIARDSRRAAFDYVERIEQRCRALRRMPQRFPIAFRLDPPVRQRTLGRHYIFYSVQPDHVLIERVLEASRDISAAMFRR